MYPNRYFHIVPVLSLALLLFGSCSKTLELETDIERILDNPESELRLIPRSTLTFQLKDMKEGKSLQRTNLFKRTLAKKDLNDRNQDYEPMEVSQINPNLLRKLHCKSEFPLQLNSECKMKIGNKTALVSYSYNQLNSIRFSSMVSSIFSNDKRAHLSISLINDTIRYKTMITTSYNNGGFWDPSYGQKQDKIKSIKIPLNDLQKVNSFPQESKMALKLLQIHDFLIESHLNSNPVTPHHVRDTSKFHQDINLLFHRGNLNKSTNFTAEEKSNKVWVKLVYSEKYPRGEPRFTVEESKEFTKYYDGKRGAVYAFKSSLKKLAKAILTTLASMKNMVSDILERWI